MATYGNAVIRETRGAKATRAVLLALALGFVLVMLVLPLASIIAKSLSLGIGYYLHAITTEYVISALGVTLLATVVSVVFATVFGLLASWALTNFRFPGQQVLTTLIDIPFSVSPVIAGLAFVLTFGRRGWARPIIDSINSVLGTDIQLVFSIPGVILATIFVTFPFVVRELLPVMHSQGSDEEQAAALMGAKGPRILKQITVPKIRWALLYGIILCAARAFGEFGAVYTLSKTRGETFTLPLEIDALYMAGTPDSIIASFAVSSLLVLLAVALLVARYIVEQKVGKKADR